MKLKKNRNFIIAMSTQKKIFLNEDDKIKKALSMSYSERFHLLMKLIRINKMLKKATIIHHDK